MLVKEMHIEFELGLQKLNSSSKRKFYKEQIDVFLNKAQDQFIKDSIRVEEDSRGFQTTQVDVDRIRNLVVTQTLPAEHIESNSSYKEYLVQLPSDYAYLISDAWYQAKDCEASNNSTVVNRYYYKIPIHITTKVSAPYYVTFKIDHDTDVIVDLDFNSRQGNGEILWAGQPSKTEHFEIVALARELYHRFKRNSAYSGGADLVSGTKLLGLYYERYNNLFFPGQLILILSTNTGTVHTVTDATTRDISVSGSIPYTQHGSLLNYERVAGRLVRSSKIDNILTTPYYRPLEQSPVLTVQENTIRVFVHKNRIVNRSTILYIRQPQKISLSLHSNCELAETFHGKIVDMAVSYAASRIEADKLLALTESEKRN